MPRKRKWVYSSYSSMYTQIGALSQNIDSFPELYEAYLNIIEHNTELFEKHKTVFLCYMYKSLNIEYQNKLKEKFPQLEDLEKFILKSNTKITWYPHDYKKPGWGDIIVVTNDNPYTQEILNVHTNIRCRKYRNPVRYVFNMDSGEGEEFPIPFKFWQYQHIFDEE